jgi:type II secretion system protein G
MGEKRRRGTMARRRHAGFTLIEMLIVVTIIGIIAGIGIPNLLGAVQRAKQKKTMGDMAAIATAAESYAIDFSAYPPAAAMTTHVIFGNLSYPTVTVGSLAANYMAPTYLKVVPLTDGWNSWFLYTSNETDYAIVSPGKDGIVTKPAIAGPSTNFNTDIVFSDGQFTVYPEGAQQQ